MILEGDHDAPLSPPRDLISFKDLSSADYYRFHFRVSVCQFRVAILFGKEKNTKKLNLAHMVVCIRIRIVY